MSEDLNKRHKAALDVALLDLDVAAIPSKSDVFVRCGPAARDLHDAITDLRARLQAAEERAEKLEGALEGLVDAIPIIVGDAGRRSWAYNATKLPRAYDAARAALKTEGA